jgi:hypothetical protein
MHRVHIDSESARAMQHAREPATQRCTYKAAHPFGGVFGLAKCLYRFQNGSVTSRRALDHTVCDPHIHINSTRLRM